jgi:hypothetical protein
MPDHTTKDQLLNRIKREHAQFEAAYAPLSDAQAEQFAIDRDRPLAEVRTGFAQSYQQMLALIDSLSEEDLSESSRLAPFLGSRVLAAVAEDTYEHCQEHVDSIRAWTNQETSNS